jgi:DNA adenine methylase
MIPSQFNRYFEPFLGGGAMFLHLMSSGMRFNACLSDTNAKLITAYLTAYRAVKDNVRLLQRYEYEYKKYPGLEQYCVEGPYNSFDRDGRTRTQR